MQIQKVQSNQPNFGTKVVIDPFAARQISLIGAKTKVLNHIKALENNGVNDTLFLSYSNFYMSDSISCRIMGTVIESKNGEYFINQPYRFRLLVEKQANGKNKYISIKELYNEARKNMTRVFIDKKGFEKFKPYFGIE